MKLPMIKIKGIRRSEKTGAARITEKGFTGARVESAYRVSGRERLRYYAVCAPALAFIGYMFYDNLLAAGAFALLAFLFEGRYKVFLEEKQRKRLSFEFRDLLLSVSSSFQAGRHMKEALAEAEGYLAGSLAADSPMLSELRIMNKRLGQGGESEKDVLGDFAARSASEDIRSFIDVYFACLDTGGDMIKAVARSSETLVDKIGIDREAETLTAQKRYEIMLLGGTPVVILAFLRLGSSDYVKPLYTTLAGMLTMSAALVLLAVSFIWSRRILKTEV